MNPQTENGVEATYASPKKEPTREKYFCPREVESHSREWLKAIPHEAFVVEYHYLIISRMFGRYQLFD